jgi:hypothetical protein
MNAKINEIFPPFMNLAKLGFNFGIQGMQFTAVSSTAENQTLATITDFSFSDKLRLNSELATLLKKEGKTGAVGKAAKKSAKASDGDKPKRKAAPGTLAWMALVKHCKTTMAERFEGCTKEPERLTICKAIRSEDSATYDAFIKEFKENHGSSAPADADAAEDADADAAEPEPVVPAPTPASKAEKLAAAKAAAAAKKAAPASEAKKPVKKAEPASEAKAPAAAGEAKKAKKPVKSAKAAAAKTAAAAETQDAMPQIEIDGENYFHDRSNNGLWKVEEDNTFGAWVGYYQPTDAESPIRFTDSME